MKKILLTLSAVALLMGSVAAVQAQCPGCAGAGVSGYLAPNFRMIDKGEDNNANMGFGMAFNRFRFSGTAECGPIVKKVGYRVEVDASNPQEIDLQDVFVQPHFNDLLSFRMGRFKKAFGRELLHPTAKLMTVDRHAPSSHLAALHYGDFDTGLELIASDPKFMITAGAYAGGKYAPKHAGGQDPAIDLGARAIFKPMPDLEIGANAMMVALPGVYEMVSGDDTPEDTSDDVYMWNYAFNAGVYADDTALYQSNSGMAFGFDLDYQKQFNEKMGLWLQAEMGMGDNWMLSPKDAKAEDTWEDYSWYGFMYYGVKAIFMVTPQFGVHLGYSAWDPNTDSDAGKNDAHSMITPGIVYKWCKATRTQFEVQMVTQQNGVDSEGKNLDDDSYTHFVLQQVFTW
ncbi:MAG: hypothetical protein FJY75_01680 [Candidatus Eisenbacteria bacterium]|uniref:Porin n=1 Tax=Eiseniibacteriota bacterium TaxID=2212470 RepID=A0A937X7E8_UNCEI|nr:hypothetical protein [Candidatus Eisenbacteria bacterium]